MINELQAHIIDQLITDVDELSTFLENAVDLSDHTWEELVMRVARGTEKAKSISKILVILQASVKGTPKEGPYR